MTCVSFLKPSTNSGRMGRSISREVRVSFSVGRPSLLKVAAGDLARRVAPLLIVHSEWEKVHAGPHRFCCYHGGQHARFTILGEHGTVGLAGELSGLKLKLAPAPFNFHTMDVKHFASFESESPLSISCRSPSDTSFDFACGRGRCAEEFRGG